MRVTRPQVVEAIKNNCFMSTNVVPQTQVNIDEVPTTGLRHSCLLSGVTILPMYQFPVCDEQMGETALPFFFCPLCGKLYVYRSLWE